MGKPKPKLELIVERCPNPKCISVHTATPRAAEWIYKEALQFSENPALDRISMTSVPGHNSFIISPCYDIDEVVEYLANPVYGKTEPVKLMK